MSTSDAEVAAAKAGDSRARNKIIKDNASIVSYLIRSRYASVPHLWDDLRQAGLIGINKAIGKYEPGRGANFRTYATAWVSQAVQRERVSIANDIRIPHHANSAARRVRRGAARPGDAQYEGLDRGHTISLDATRSPDGEYTLYGLVAAETPSPHDIVVARQGLAHVASVLGDGRDAQIVWRSALGYGAAESGRTAGVGVTRQRVHQIVEHSRRALLEARLALEKPRQRWSPRSAIDVALSRARASATSPGRAPTAPPPPPQATGKDARDREMRAMAAAGMSARQISARYGLSAHHTSQIVADARAERLKARYRLVSELHSAGRTFAQISAIVGMRQKSLETWWHRQHQRGRQACASPSARAEASAE